MSSLAARLHTITPEILTKLGGGSGPIVIPPASGLGLSGLATYADDFTGYADTAALQNAIAKSAGGAGAAGVLYNDGLNGSYASLDPTVLYNGHQTMKYSQPGGVMTTPQLYVGFSKGALPSMWLRVKLRYSPGWSTVGTQAGYANSYKIFGWGWSGADGRGTLEYTNTNQYSIDWDVVVNGSTTGPTAVKNGPNVVNEWSDGNWYEYIIYVQQTSSTTVRTRWWLAQDGTAPVLNADITGTMKSGTAPSINRVMIGMNYNSARPTANNQAIWVGEWEIVDPAKSANPFSLSL